jgi:hypothetical protein
LSQKQCCNLYLARACACLHALYHLTVLPYQAREAPVTSLRWKHARETTPSPLLSAAPAHGTKPSRRSPHLPLTPRYPPGPSLAPNRPASPGGDLARRHGHTHVDHSFNTRWCLWTAVAVKGARLHLGSVRSVVSLPSLCTTPTSPPASIPLNTSQMDATSPPRDPLVAPRHWHHSKNPRHDTNTQHHRPFHPMAGCRLSFSHADHGAPCTTCLR